MIDIPTSNSRKCDGVSRREYLLIGSLGPLGLALPDMLRASDKKSVSCILLWLSGGISQIDSFDPKPEAPAEIRGEFKTTPTATPGVHFVEHLPRLAKMSNRFSLLRSMTHNQGAHGLADQLVITGYAPTPSGAGIRYPSQGSIVSWRTGYRNGVPPYIFVGDVQGPSFARKRDALNAGVLGAEHNPLEIGDGANEPGFSVKDVTLAKGVDLERLNSRRQMLSLLDRWQRDTDVKLARLNDVDNYYGQAYSLVTSQAAKKAFNLQEEPDKVRDSYGRTMFGQSCLLARRLVEAGVRYVTVGMPGWDTHRDNFRDLKDKLLPVLDMAYSALIQDLDDRGMTESTLLLCLGEFGRTPKINSEAGRDHWPATQVVAMGGGGVKRGVVLGETNERSEYPTERPVSVQDFCATTLHALGIPLNLEYRSAENRPITVVKGGDPIADLLV
jgi:hypothetical protein